MMVHARDEAVKKDGRKYSKEVTVVTLKNKSDDYSRSCCLWRVMELLLN